MTEEEFAIIRDKETRAISPYRDRVNYPQTKEFLDWVKQHESAPNDDDYNGPF